MTELDDQVMSNFSMLSTFQRFDPVRMNGNRVNPHIDLICKVIPLKLFLDMVSILLLVNFITQVV